MQRFRAFVSGGYLEVHWDTCQLAVVDFMFALTEAVVQTSTVTGSNAVFSHSLVI